MATTGFCRLRPIHVDQLAKRYRQKYGELKYWRRHSGSVEQIDLLERVCASILNALSVYGVAHTQLDLRPIRFMRPELLTNAQLVRALLSAMRIAEHQVHVDDIACAVIANAGLPTDPDITDRMRQRVSQALMALGKSGIVRPTATDVWIICC